MQFAFRNLGAFMMYIFVAITEKIEAFNFGFRIGWLEGVQIANKLIDRYQKKSV